MRILTFAMGLIGHVGTVEDIVAPFVFANATTFSLAMAESDALAIFVEWKRYSQKNVTKCLNIVLIFFKLNLPR